MSCTAIGLVGKRFGRLVAGPATKRKNAWHYLCQCDCGNTKEIAGSSLSSGLTRSCGCLAAEMRGPRSGRFVHGLTRTPEYVIWQNMIKRCNDPNNQDWHNYGGRGIKVCDRWRHSFLDFLGDVGKRPAGLTLDRKDVNGHYEPGNVRWATAQEQATNQRPRVAPTHCGHGHAFTPENTYISKSKPNQRYCNECRKRNKRQSYRRNKAAEAA